MNIEDLTPQQMVVYNDMIINFFKDYDPHGPLRFGQAFYNFYYGTVFNGSFPELFYCEDNHKAMTMIVPCLIEYIKRER